MCSQLEVTLLLSSRENCVQSKEIFTFALNENEMETQSTISVFMYEILQNI